MRFAFMTVRQLGIGMFPFSAGSGHAVSHQAGQGAPLISVMLPSLYEAR
jgi:hypothetical protein